MENTWRWFCDHVLERLVWGGPTPSLFRPQRLMFLLFKTVTARFVRRDFAPLPPSDAGAGGGHAAAATILQLPPDVVPYKRLPPEGVFTAATIPRGLLSRHNTKPEVWGEITVVKGLLQLNQLEGQVEEVVLSPATGPGVVAPGQYHIVKPLTEDIEMFLRFNARPGTGPPAAADGGAKRGPGFG